MTARLAVLLMGAAWCLCAQFQLVKVTGSSEQAVGAQYDVGTILPGGSRDVSFRLKNAGTAAASLTVLSATGVGFSILNPPALPQPVASGSAIDFTVHFAPNAAGLFSAVLAADGISVILLGAGAATTAGGTVYLEQPDGTRVLLHTGDTVDFGTIPRGATVERHFIIVNQAAAPLTVNNVSLSGSYFALGDHGLLPVTLPAAASVTIRVLFQPQATGIRHGAVRIEHQDFFLQGEGADAFPQPGIFLDLPSPHSAQQGTLSIVLPSPSPVSGEGTVTLVFHPAVAGVVADPGVMFLSTSSGTVIFTVTQGESSGKFAGGAQDISFQTGTTAGDILFTAQLPGWQAQATATIASAAIGLDSIHALRTAAGLDVKIDGFDNTRTASQFTFTFFDTGGKTVSPGALNVDLTTDFRTFFDRSQVGGVFGLRAVFPVTGDASLINSVSIALTNAAGITRVDRLKFTAQ